MTRGRPKELTNQVCKGCGIEFAPDVAGRKYHSEDCYHTSRTGKQRGRYVEPETRYCETCGDPFPVGGGGNPRKDTRYCSIACGQYGRERPEANELAPADAAYLAGLTDGEGCITLSIHRGVLEARLTVAQAKHAVLIWAVEIAGVGSIYTPKKGNNPVSQLHMTGSGAISFIKQLRPYLRVKAAQADIVMAAYERSRDPKQRADQTWQLEAIAQIRAFNTRIPLK